MKQTLSALGLVFSLGLAAAPATAQELTPEEVKQLALEAILENPEIIMQAVEILQSRENEAQQLEAEEVLTSRRDELENDPNAPVLGNPEGDVTVVEFFDYNCPYCKRSVPTVTELLNNDSNVRLVLREWPILGAESVLASRAALAAREQGKYEEMHNELMALNGRATETTIMEAAERAGLDTEQLRTDMEAPEIDEHFNQSAALARALGFSGTPSFVIGDELVPGFVELGVLEELVEASRTSG
ncbi:DsbA family protein [Amaricoccus tamworthensis]|uniref:DsbA family protein n=1 Tax=Amaricoccus tamworthensis TaxID=57002 RepID=UPI003C7E9812